MNRAKFEPVCEIAPVLLSSDDIESMRHDAEAGCLWRNATVVRLLGHVAALGPLQSAAAELANARAALDDAWSLWKTASDNGECRAMSVEEDAHRDRHHAAASRLESAERSLRDAAFALLGTKVIR